MLLRVIVKQLYADNCFSPSLLCLFLWAIYARPPANMCVCVCVCVYTCVFVCICVFACIRVSVCCVYVSVHKCLYMCLNSLMQVYVHTSVYACIIQSQNSWACHLTKSTKVWGGLTYQYVLFAVKVGGDLHEPLAFNFAHHAHVLLAGQNKLMVYHPAGHDLKRGGRAYVEYLQVLQRHEIDHERHGNAEALRKTNAHPLENDNGIQITLCRHGKKLAAGIKQWSKRSVIAQTYLRQAWAWVYVYCLGVLDCLIAAVLLQARRVVEEPSCNGFFYTYDRDIVRGVCALCCKYWCTCSLQLLKAERQATSHWFEVKHAWCLAELQCHTHGENWIAKPAELMDT